MSKKKKVLIIALAVLLTLIVLAIVLMFTTFSLKKLEVEFETTTSYDSTLLQEEISQNADVEFGKSIFFVNRSKTIESVEQQYPNLKVINIEYKFPNKMIVHLAQRQELFAFLKDGKYLITDEDLKVLYIQDSFQSNQNNAILVNQLTPIGNSEDIKLSSILSFDTLGQADFYAINYSLFENNRTKIESMAYFKTIEFSQRTNPVSFESEKTLILESHDGFKYEIYNFQSGLTKKMNKLFASDVALTPDLSNGHKMIVYENSSGEIYAKLATA